MVLAHGKTALLLAALLASVPPTERVVIVEDAEDCARRTPHQVPLVARSANVEGVGALPLRAVRQALRMRPDRLVVVKCGEAAGGRSC